MSRGRLAIIGAGGHGLVVADSALAGGWDEVSFFDDRFRSMPKMGVWSILGNIDDLCTAFGAFDGVIAAIGNNPTRLKIFEDLKRRYAPVVSIVHPNAWVSPNANLGQGSVVCAGAVINIAANIGDAAIINTGATVDHDCQLGRGVHVSPGAHLAGGVTVGELSWIGVGAAIRDRMTIGENTTVGAGAVVVSNIADGVVVYGNPARPKE